MKPWPGRNVTPQWSEGELELFPPRTLSGCSGIADSLLLIPHRQHFLAHLLPWTVLGVRLFVKLEALSFSFRSFPFPTLSRVRWLVEGDTARPSAGWELSYGCWWPVLPGHRVGIHPVLSNVLVRRWGGAKLIPIAGARFLTRKNELQHLFIAIFHVTSRLQGMVMRTALVPPNSGKTVPGLIQERPLKH